jgi:hypothetical protein
MKPCLEECELFIRFKRPLPCNPYLSVVDLDGGASVGPRFANLTNNVIVSRPYNHCKKKYAAVWNQKLYIGEYSGISQ